eukprot:CAMPEP_0178373202 /NCGR_PEP_ID=MMETSP0689_2-20121128/1743_1 /TAXON_ID=160604 /ORGANISM="Amphidinium massartii, Strain CS-259" /LENGTH=192 /DNA_ID=CAMNT_0019993141 /DNA_START=193 /DNA_END=771 /DNA_ORIENTATION=+
MSSDLQQIAALPKQPQKCQQCSKQKPTVDDVVCPYCNCIEDNRDPGYHYEELTSRQLPKYAIWDVPGSEAMQNMWPMFYRYIEVSAILFVVDGSHEGAQHLQTARSRIHYLFREDELQTSAFILIVNTKGQEEINREAIYAELEISSLEQAHWDKLRFRKYELDLGKITPTDTNWKRILADIKKIMVCMVDF